MQTNGKHNVLVIEDDRDIAHLTQLHLCDLGYEVDIAHDGAVGFQQTLSGSYDMVILDLTLPGMDGLEICQRLRSQPTYPLILMLTSRTTELDRVLGLEMGADDYLTKPFSIREMVARVKALFRRRDALGSTQPLCPQKENMITAGDLIIDIEKRVTTLLQIVVNLTAKEFDLLLLFACHPGRVYTRTQLLELIWGYAYEGYEHTVNSHINRLRAKIEKNSSQPRYLLTVWGVGYKFMEQGC